MITSGWHGPGWLVTDTDPVRGTQVRHWLTAAIGRHDCPADPEDAALAVGELFTNAIMHGPAGGRVLTGYCLWSAGARILVCDGGGPGDPRVVHPAGSAEGGRGLQLIDAISAQWGCFRLPGAQVVWCDLGAPLRIPASDAWAWLRPVLSTCPLSPPVRPPAAIAAPDALASAAHT